MNSEFAIVTERYSHGKRVIEIDTKKAHYKGIPWQTLGNFGKRKFENLLVLAHPKESIKPLYL